jgi:hypothetical protein
VGKNKRKASLNKLHRTICVRGVEKGKLSGSRKLFVFTYHDGCDSFGAYAAGFLLYESRLMVQADRTAVLSVSFGECLSLYFYSCWFPPLFCPHVRFQPSEERISD